MLRGRFGNTSGRPYFEGRLVIPSLGIANDFSFLMDTGADSTFLMEDDAAVMNVDYSRLTRQQQAYGIGGPSANYLEEAYVMFDDSTQLYIYRLNLAIAPPDGRTRGLPSLLGRDVVHHWDLRYCFGDDCVEAEVRTALVISALDGSFPYPPLAPNSLPD